MTASTTELAACSCCSFLTSRLLANLTRLGVGFFNAVSHPQTAPLYQCTTVPCKHLLITNTNAATNSSYYYTVIEKYYVFKFFLLLDPTSQTLQCAPP